MDTVEQWNGIFFICKQANCILWMPKLTIPSCANPDRWRWSHFHLQNLATKLISNQHYFHPWVHHSAVFKLPVDNDWLQLLLSGVLYGCLRSENRCPCRSFIGAHDLYLTYKWLGCILFCLVWLPAASASTTIHKIQIRIELECLFSVVCCIFNVETELKLYDTSVSFQCFRLALEHTIFRAS